MWRVLSFVLVLLLFSVAAHAQTGCVPNPNDNGQPFTNGCPLTAKGLNTVGISMVSNNDALRGLSVLSAPPFVRRQGRATAGDGGQADYSLNTTANCPAANNGNQVQPSTGTGCWFIIYGQETDVRVWTGAPNGTIDNTADLQNALNAAAQVTTLMIPLVSTPFQCTHLTVPSHTSIRGGGWNSWLQEINGGLGSCLDFASNTDITIDGVELDGNKANNAAGGSCITMTAATHWMVRNSKIHDCPSDAVYYAGQYFGINNNEIYNIGTTTFPNASGVENVLGQTAANFTVSGNIVNGTNGADLACGNEGCSFGTFQGNTLSNPGQGGQPADCITGYAHTNHDLTVNGNVCTGSGNGGISVGGNDVTMVGNIVYNTTVANCITAYSAEGYTTGTITLTNGSKAVTGSGTSWLGLNYPYAGFGAALTAASQSLLVSNISSNTALTLTANFVGTTASYNYALKANMPISNPTIVGNTCRSPTLDGFAAYIADGAVITGNNVIGAGSLGVWCDRCKNSTITGNVAKANTSSGIYVSSPYYQGGGGGTVSVTNGSPTVTGSGFLANMPQDTASGSDATTGVWLRVGTDAQIYQGTVTSDTNITLLSNYQGATNGSASYFVSYDPPNRNSIVGNTSNSNGAAGISIFGCQECDVSGNTVVSNSADGIFESSTAFADTFVLNNLSSNTPNNYSLLVPTPGLTVTSGATDCGTSPMIVGTNRGGFVEVGTSTNGSVCTVAFNPAYDANNAPICFANNQTTSGNPVAVTNITTSGMKLKGTFAANDFLDYRCYGARSLD